MKRILFVCSGNIFRSLIAEYALKHYLKSNFIKGYKVSSAGTIALPQKIRNEVKEELLKRGINPSRHKQRRLNNKIIQENDLIVVMAKNHH
jgi:protein-tyrosine phosphatase